jgi:hypothetical protein
MDRDLTAELRTGGFALAHAAGSVETGEPLCTLAFVASDDRRTWFRYEASSIPESVALAHGHLAEEVRDGAHAALVFDGTVTREDGTRTDAFLVEIIGPRGVRVGQFVQAYRAPRRRGLPLHLRATEIAILGRPIIEPSIGGDDAEAAILDGIREHRDGPRLFELART